MFALEIKNLTKTYRTGTKALDALSLEVREGDFFALLGPNGAGKTTLISIVSNLLHQTSGEVVVNGYDVSTKPNDAKVTVGLVPQEFNCNIFERVIDIVLDQAGYYGIERKDAFEMAERVLQDLGLYEKRFDKSQSLSGGMKRRLLIARALMHEPKLLLLDEPTAGVDVELRRTMWEYLKKINNAGTTIILTTHYLEEAEQLCKNVAVINHGKIVLKDSMTELLSKSGNKKLEDIYLELIQT